MLHIQKWWLIPYYTGRYIVHGGTCRYIPHYGGYKLQCVGYKPHYVGNKPYIFGYKPHNSRYKPDYCGLDLIALGTHLMVGTSLIIKGIDPIVSVTNSMDGGYKLNNRG